MSSAKLTFCGAAREVTGSCYHLEVDGEALIVDCGVFQGSRDADERNRAPFLFEPHDLRAVVLTHGHLDHTGRTPLLYQRGCRAPVIGHAASLEIAMLIMEDSAKIAQHSDGPPLYTADDVARVREALAPVRRYGDTFTHGPFRIKFFDAGHILGSSSVRIEWGKGSEQRAILFSGDLGMIGSPLIRDPNVHWDATADAIDYVVTESTYGDKLHPPRTEVRAKFREIVLHALRDGGRVLIPAFSIGRTQEIIYELNAMIEAGELTGIPVVVDGPLGVSATRLYDKYTDLYDQEALALVSRGDEPLEFDSLQRAYSVNQSKRATSMSGPAIIIAGSGMLQGGRIRHHLREHISDPRTDVLLVGYQAEATLGRALQDGAQQVWLSGERIDVRARITTISGFSAHADRDVLTHWFDHLPRASLRRAFVTHGEEAVSLSYAALLTQRFGVQADVPAYGTTVEL